MIIDNRMNLNDEDVIHQTDILNEPPDGMHKSAFVTKAP